MVGAVVRPDSETMYDYEFEGTEIEGSEYVIARPDRSGREPIRLRGDWLERNESKDEGNWEPVVRTLVMEGMLQADGVTEGGGRLNRTEAVSVLAERAEFVGDEDHAEALLAYLASEDVIRIDGSELVVLSSINDEDVSSGMFINWAASLEACLDRIDARLEAYESRKQKVESRLERTEAADTESVDRKLEEAKQELLSLGDGPGRPDPAQLSEADRERFSQLRDKITTYMSVKEAEEPTPGAGVERVLEKLVTNLDRLEVIRGQLDNYVIKTRSAAFARDQEEEMDVETIERMEELFLTVAGGLETKEELQDLSDDQFLDALEEEESVIEEAVETAEAQRTEREPAGETDLEF